MNHLEHEPFRTRTERRVNKNKRMEAENFKSRGRTEITYSSFTGPPQIQVHKSRYYYFFVQWQVRHAEVRLSTSVPEVTAGTNTAPSNTRPYT